MKTAWDVVTRWETFEPVEHRPPIPEVLVEAMLAVAVSWGWLRWAAITLIGFRGIVRPGEPVSAQRSHLLLPQDLLQSNLDHFYFKIEKPKTRKRGGAKVQHSKIVGVDVVAFVVAVFAALPRHEKLYPGSASHYRRRWDAILKALEVPPCLKLTPGGLRGGGAVAAYRHGTPVSDILWRMRIKHMQT